MDKRFFGFFFDQQYYLFKRVTFGFINSMGWFNKAFRSALLRIKTQVASEAGIFIDRYVDSCLIGTQTLQQHVRVWRIVLAQLASDGWTLRPAKIQWLKDNLHYFGIHISRKEIQLLEGMISKPTNLPRPKLQGSCDSCLSR